LTVCKKQPANKDAREKYQITQKEYKEGLLRKALERDEKVEYSEQEIAVESTYTGPRLENADDIDAKWVESLMEW
jgi:hypothetical protein